MFSVHLLIITLKDSYSYLHIICFSFILLFGRCYISHSFSDSLCCSFISASLIIPHVQHERGKVIGVGVHRYICMFVDQINLLNRTVAFDSPFQIFIVGLHRPALPLQKCFLSSSKSRIFLYNVHLALFVWMDDTITHTNASVSNVISILKLALEVRVLPSPFADQTTARIIANSGKNLREPALEHFHH